MQGAIWSIEDEEGSKGEEYHVSEESKCTISLNKEEESHANSCIQEINLLYILFHSGQGIISFQGSSFLFIEIKGHAPIYTNYYFPLSMLIHRS